MEERKEKKRKEKRKSGKLAYWNMMYKNFHEANRESVIF